MTAKHFHRFLAALAVFAVADAPAFAQMAAVELPPLPGGSWAAASAMNDAGDVVGESDRGDGVGVHAVIWTAAHGVKDLGTLGGPNSRALQVNARGEIVGVADTPQRNSHAFYTTATGEMLDLGTLGGEWSIPRAISDSGYVVGVSAMADGSVRAFLWRRGTRMLDLGLLSGCQSSVAVSVNSTGQVVGWNDCEDLMPRAFLWTAAHGMVALGDVDTDRASSDAVAVNEGGMVVGNALAAGGVFHGVAWTSVGRRIDLGLLPDTDGCSAAAVNNAGEVVGVCDSKEPYGPTRRHAFRWTRSRGMEEIRTAAWSGVATGINEAGQIIGYTLDYQDTIDDPHQAFTWTAATGAMTLDPVSPWAFYTVPRAVNGRGQVAGVSDASAMLWQPVEKTLEPVADAYVRAGAFASTNFGSAVKLTVKKGASDDATRRIYLKFDISNVDSQDRVTLRVTGGLSNGSTPVAETTVYAVGDVSWDEHAVTWNTRPAIGAVLGRLTVGGPGPRAVSVDVTQYVRAARAAGATQVAFALRNVAHTSASVVFNSREASAATPALVITRSSTP